jgi:hypothetical protein
LVHVFPNQKHSTLLRRVSWFYTRTNMIMIEKVLTKKSEIAQDTILEWLRKN